MKLYLKDRHILKHSDKLSLKVYLSFVLIIVLKYLVYKVLKLCKWLFPEIREGNSILLRQGSWTFDMFYVFYSQGGGESTLLEVLHWRGPVLIIALKY